MKKKSSKRKFVIAHKNTQFNQQQQQQKQLFHKVTRAFTQGCLRPSQHKKLVGTLVQRVKRPNTAYTMKMDYTNLKNLVDCNQKLYRNRDCNINRLKSIKQMSAKKQSEQKFYHPLNYEIKKTQKILKRKKNEKFSQEKLQTYYHRKISERQIENNENKQQIQKSESDVQIKINEVIEMILNKGIREVQKFRAANYSFFNKLKVFGSDYLQKNKDTIVQEATNFLKKQSKGIKISQQYQTYILNHFLLQKLMSQILIDTKILENKNNCRNIYNKIKDQMVSQLIDQQKFLKFLQTIMHTISSPQKFTSASNKQNIMVGFQRNRSKQSLKKGNRLKTYESTIFTSNRNNNRQSEIIKQFDRVYDLAQSKIYKAQENLYVKNKKKNIFQSLFQSDQGKIDL